MRTYILALTKYGIAAVMVAYTVVAFLILIKSKRSERTLTFIQSLLLLAFQLISYVTLTVALEDDRYIFFSVVQLITFFAAVTLYRLLYKKAYMPLFNNMCMMLSVGLVIISRLSFDRAWKQFTIVAAGLVMALIMPLFRNQFYLLKKPKYFMGLLGIAILAVVMMLGSTTYGANITYTVAGLTFQPSEFVKILYIIFLASTLKDIHDLKDVFVVGIFAAAHVLVLIGSRDLGGGLIFYVVFFFMLYLATGQLWMLLSGGGLLAAGAVFCYYMFDHVQQRVVAFKDPWSVIDGIGYQITQALFAIGAGGAFGTGLGQGIPEKIPFVWSDFIFAAVAEEFGLVVGVCLILICLNCFMIMLKLAMGFADKFYQLLAYGIAICFGFQTFLTIGGQAKFIPLTGVTLPLVSYGGSSILSTLILFTLVEIVYMLREERIDEYKKRQKQNSRVREERYALQKDLDNTGEIYRDPDYRDRYVNEGQYYRY